MKKAAKERVFWVSLLVICVVLGWSFAGFGDFYVIPTVKRLFAPVEKTGQTICYDAAGTEIPCAGTGQDGEIQKGVAWPDPRFTDNLNGTVTDNLTGLIWTENAGCISENWQNVLDYCNDLADGLCGLSDGSQTGDWRLANRNELLTLVNIANNGPALPDGHPFTNPSHSYFSSSSYFNGIHAWFVSIYSGDVGLGSKSGTFYGWCVRGGQ